jgi:hypothetical protein
VIKSSGETGLTANKIDVRRGKPVFDYRTIDASKLIGNILDGRADFERFVEEIESYAAGSGREEGKLD